MTSAKYRCDALPTELWSHTLGARPIYWVHISHERKRKRKKNPIVTPNNKSCINKRCRLENLRVLCIRYFSKMKSKPAKKITGQCCSTEMEVACENSVNLEQETITTKIVTYPLFPLASSYVCGFCCYPHVLICRVWHLCLLPVFSV